MFKKDSSSHKKKDYYGYAVDDVIPEEISVGKSKKSKINDKNSFSNSRFVLKSSDRNSNGELNIDINSNNRDRERKETYEIQENMLKNSNTKSKNSNNWPIVNHSNQLQSKINQVFNIDNLNYCNEYDPNDDSNKKKLAKRMVLTTPKQKKEFNVNNTADSLTKIKNFVLSSNKKEKNLLNKENNNGYSKFRVEKFESTGSEDKENFNSSNNQYPSVSSNQIDDVINNILINKETISKK